MGKFTKRNNIIIRSVEAKRNVVSCHVEVSQKINKYFNTEKFFIEFEEDMSEVPVSILACPFVASLLAVAWITDSVIWVEEIDRTFYESLTRVKSAYQDIYVGYGLGGRVVPSVFRKNYISDCKDCPTQSLILFSGGADCHASLIRNWDKNPLLCNIQGWFKDIDDVDPVADADRRDIGTFASGFGLSFSYVRSNFAKIMNLNRIDHDYKKKVGDTMWHGFLHSMAFISIAMPLAYKHGIKEIIIASSLTTGLNFLCASNSTTDSEFRFASDGEVLHDGFELHRQNKIHVITEFQKRIDRPYFMRVCSFHDSNCCECEKCFRTILGIVAENSDPELFGFHHKGTLRQHWEYVMKERIAFMGFSSEKSLHWPHIISRMKANYGKMDAEKREFVDWFMSYDFVGAKKKAVRKYRFNNFFSLVLKKIKGHV